MNDDVANISKTKMLIYKNKNSNTLKDYLKRKQNDQQMTFGVR